jgi:precorrin isomerase
MTDDDAERLTPAEERVRTLLHPFSEEQAPHGDELTRSIAHTARWQRPLRRALVVVGTAGAALGGGFGSLVRGRRGR